LSSSSISRFEDEDEDDDEDDGSAVSAVFAGDIALDSVLAA
jgi:hypothetical protein